MLLRYTIMLLAGVLSGCALLDSDSSSGPLKGERLPILTTEGLAMAEQIERTPMHLPSPEHLETWPYSTLVANALPANILVTKGANKAKSLNLSLRTDLHASPVLTDGRAYFANCAGELFYNSLVSPKLWFHQVALGHGKQMGKECLDTGMTVQGTHLYVTKGDQTLTAVDLVHDTILWHYEVPSALDIPVIYHQGNLVLLMEDNTLQVIDAATAQPKWQEKMAMEEVGVLGQALPIASQGILYVPYNTGLMVAYHLESGEVVWTANLAYAQFGKSSLNFNDSNTPPVVRDGVVYVANNSGALFAIGAHDGALLWHTAVELPQTIWVAGNRVFVRNMEHKLYAFDRSGGAKQWELDLMSEPVLRQKKKRGQKKETQLLTQGPLLINNQLVVTTSTGLLLQIDPAQGKVVQTLPIPESNSTPVIGNDQLYVWDMRGKLVPVSLPE